MSDHPGRPDRPEGPPPTITREDWFYSGAEAMRELVAEEFQENSDEARKQLDRPCDDPCPNDPFLRRVEKFNEQAAQFVRSLDLPAVPTLLDVDRHYREFREERVDVARSLTPADQALETLALMAEHSITLWPHVDSGWIARAGSNSKSSGPWVCHHGSGATIGDAVRSCVERIVKEKT